MKLSEKVAYLKGLEEGLNPASPSPNSSKAFSKRLMKS